jgi:4-amino-4-deoxy-L-arabinose transferase-like glycosyltransferase
MIEKPAASPGEPSRADAAPRRGIPGLSWFQERRHLLAIAAAATVLGARSLYEIGRYSFSQDEIASVVYSSAPLQDLLTIVGRDRNVADVPFMATYNLVLHFWLYFADSEAEIRLLSVIAACAATIPIYFIGKRLGGWLAGALGALTFAAMPFVIHWSRFARAYSLGMLVTATLTLLLLRALERPTLLRFAAYGITGAVGMYVHSFVALVIVVHAAYVVLNRSWPARGPLLAAAVPLALAAAPFPFLALQYGSAYGHIPDLTLDQIRITLVSIAGGLPRLVAMTALIAAALALHRNDSRVWLVLATVIVPIALVIAASTVRPLLHARYVIVLLPSAAILAGVGLASLRPVTARVAAGVAFATLLALAIPSTYVDWRQQDWRGATAWIAASAQPGDDVIVSHQRTLTYYLERANAAALTLWPRIDLMERRTEDAGHLWLVLTDQTLDGKRRAIERLERIGFRTVDWRDFGDRVTVVRMTPRGGR